MPRVKQIQISTVAIAIVLLVQTAIAQTPTIEDRLKPRLFPVAPNVGHFEKYGAFAVNMATGTPNISIPIYEIKSGGITVPLNLSYYAGGFKYNEEASWVGLGWSLIAGGVLSRTVQDKPDDTHGYMTNTTPVSYNPCSADGSDFFTLRTTTYDNEPDIYSFSTPKVSGKFLMKQNQGQSKIFLPDAPLRCNHYLISSTFDYFDLIGEDGTKYIFGKDKNNTAVADFTQPANNGNYFHYSSWPLTRILAPNNTDQVNFFYQNGGTVDFSDVSYNLMIRDQVAQNSPGLISATPYSTVASYTNHATTTSQSVLQKIEFENGQVEFIASDPQMSPTPETRKDQLNAKYLKQIIVKRKVNGALQSIIEVNFSYSYFQNTMVPNYDEALKLDQVVIKDLVTNLEKKYAFQYWTDAVTWPGGSYYTARDYWGFYNGHTENQDMIPTGTIYYADLATTPETLVTIGHANREAVSTYAKEALLKKITFPTGGSTTFDYENHQYREFTTQNIKMAGGVRVTSILTEPTDGLATRKEYYYGENNDGTGVVNKDPSLSNFMTATAYKVTQPNGFFGTARQRTFFSSSLGNNEAYDNGIVYYKRVEERTMNATVTPATMEYRTVYTFTHDYDNFINEQSVGVGIIHKVTKYWRRGKPESETVINSEGQEISKKITTYSTLNYQTVYQVGSFTYLGTKDNGMISDPCPSPWGTMSASANIYRTYEAYVDAYLPGIVTEQLLPGTYEKKTTTQYDAHLQVLNSFETNSDGQTKTTSYRYPQNSNYTGVIVPMLARNMVNTQLAKTVKVGTTTVYSDQTTYKTAFGNNSQGLTDNIVIDKIEIAPDGQTLEPRITFPSYDDSGNIVTFVYEDGSVGGVPTTVIWAYDRTLPIAEIQFATRADFYSKLSSILVNGTTANPASIEALTESAKIEQLILDLQTQFASTQALVTGYIYEPNVGVVKIIDPNGKKQSYSYDGFSNLLEIRDKDNSILKTFKYHYRRN